MHIDWGSNEEKWAHTKDKHWSDLLGACIAYYHPALPEMVQAETVFNQVAAIKLREQPPRLSPAKDCRSLRNLYEVVAANGSIQTLICFSCGCPHTHVSALPNNPIQYYKVCSSAGKILHLASDQTTDPLGYNVYLERYGNRDDGRTTTNLSMPPWLEELADWKLAVHLRGKGRTELLCCPEDITCSHHRRGADESCRNCTLPLCQTCHADLHGAPARTYICIGKQFWTGYASSLIYNRKVTYLELLCASPCILGLVCVVLEVDYRRDSNQSEKHAKEPRRAKYNKRDMFREAAYDQHYRTAARGNASLSEVPLDDVYSGIERLDQRESALLPRFGADLVGLVKVIVKSRGELPASPIAHATCRRSVVLELLEEGHNRGHKDFARLNMRRARRRVPALPEHCVMPELVHVASEDGSLTKILNQNAATPHKVT